MPSRLSTGLMPSRLSAGLRQGRDGQLNSAAVQCELAWKDDEGAGLHCNNTFHRGIIACIATFMKAFNCDPQDRMNIF